MGNKAAKTQKAAAEEQVRIQKKAAQEADARRQEALGIKRSAIENIKYPTFLETPDAQNYRDILTDRIAGRGLIDVEAQTSPVAAQIRAGLDRTRSLIGSEASAAGLGRSSVVSSQVRDASEAAERDIAERMAQLELARQDQIERAVQGYGALSETEATAQANRALFEREGQFSLADTTAGFANQAAQDQYMIANSIAQNGAQQAAMQLKRLEIALSTATAVASVAAAPFTGGASLAALPGSAKKASGGGSTTSLSGSIGSNSSLASKLGY